MDLRFYCLCLVLVSSLKTLMDCQILGFPYATTAIQNIEHQQAVAQLCIIIHPTAQKLKKGVVVLLNYNYGDHVKHDEEAVLIS